MVRKVIVDTCKFLLGFWKFTWLCSYLGINVYLLFHDEHTVLQIVVFVMIDLLRDTRSAVQTSREKASRWVLSSSSMQAAAR